MVTNFTKETEFYFDTNSSHGPYRLSIVPLELINPFFSLAGFTADFSNALRQVLDFFNMDSLLKIQAPLSILSGISANVRLVVSSVVQKAFIEVNEEGSEAAAATAMMFRLLCGDPQFTCDRPFMYFIKDNLSGLVLFAGNINNPTTN